MQRTVRSIESFLGALRRRAQAIAITRAGLVAVAASAIILVPAAALVGPVTDPAVALFVWLGFVGACAGAALWSARRTPVVANGQAASLIGVVAPRFVSRLRTAFELESSRSSATFAPELVAAHAREVSRALEGIAPARIVPWRNALDRVTIGAIVVLSVAAFAFAADGRLLAGGYALAHAGERRDGLPVAALLSRFRVTVTFPAYLGRASRAFEAPEVLRLPRGAEVELTCDARVDLTRADVVLGADSVALTPRGHRRWTGRIVVDEPGTLRFRGESAGDRWLADDHAIRILPIRDEAPRVRIIAPTDDVEVELDASVELLYQARDDIGIGTVELLVRGPDGREGRRKLALPLHRLDPSRVEGTAVVVPLAFGARRGDTLSVWIEARDNDDVHGPNIGRSETLHVTVATDDARHRALLTDIGHALDHVLAALATRLELADDLHSGVTLAHAAIDGLVTSSTELERIFQAIEARAHADRYTRRADSVMLGLLHTHLDRALRAEATTFAARASTGAKRLEALETSSLALEEGSLALDDLLTRARVADARHAAHELDAIRERMNARVNELDQSDAPETRDRLSNDVARARARANELSSKLDALDVQVPDEFLNRDAMDGSGVLQAVSKLDDAVDHHDQPGAHSALDELERRLAALESGLNRTQQAIGGARDGAREHAYAEAVHELTELEREQGRLATSSEEIEARMAQRDTARSTLSPDTMRALLDRAQHAREALDQVPPRDPDSITGESLARARQRFADVGDALRSGDPAEALRMSREASGDVSDVARDLGMDAEMFGASDVGATQSARSALEAQRRAQDLERAIAAALPQHAPDPTSADRHDLSVDRGDQHSARGTASSLSQRFARAPDGSPLDPDAAAEVSEAAQAMGEAEHALDRLDAPEAARTQRRAARQLAELRERLERDSDDSSQGENGQQGDQNESESGRGQEGDADAEVEQVRIPGASDFHAPAERRRRLLDAMRHGVPAGYEDAARHYYETVLR